MSDSFLSKNQLKIGSLIFLVSLLLAGLIFLLSSILVPLILSVVVYALLTPYSNYLIRKGVPQIWSIGIPLIVLIGIILLGITYIIPQLAEQFVNLQQQIPTIYETFNRMISNTLMRIAEYTSISIDSSKFYTPIIEQVKSSTKTIVVNLSQQLVGISVILILVPLFSFFLLKDYKTFRNKMLGFLPNRFFELGWIIYYRVSKQLQGYLSGILLQSMIMSIVTTIGFKLVGLDSALLLGVLTGILNIIPYLGPLMAMIATAFITLAQFPTDPSMIMVAFSVILVAQLIDNLLVIPMLIADSVNLHAMIVICGVIVFGNLFGLFGMVVAIPLIATIKIMITGLSNGLSLAKVGD